MRQQKFRAFQSFCCITAREKKHSHYAEPRGSPASGGVRSLVQPRGEAARLYASASQVIRQKDNRLCEASISRNMHLLIDAIPCCASTNRCAADASCISQEMRCRFLKPIMQSQFHDIFIEQFPDPACGIPLSARQTSPRPK